LDGKFQKEKKDGPYLPNEEMVLIDRVEKQKSVNGRGEGGVPRKKIPKRTGDWGGVRGGGEFFSEGGLQKCGKKTRGTKKGFWGPICEKRGRL